jgi:hypothetical protein
MGEESQRGGTLEPLPPIWLRKRRGDRMIGNTGRELAISLAYCPTNL